MTPAPRRRSGFTLVELLIVITIIGILVGLLVPAVWSGVNRANDARVAGEINTLSQALTSFKNKYQDFPPSRILLSESGGYPAGALPAPYAGMAYATPPANVGGIPASLPRAAGIDDQPDSALVQRSISYLRKFFERAQFAVGTAPAIPGGFYDFNGNGVLDPAPIYLEGHECLVFFLGGIPTHTAIGTTYTLEGVEGFGQNPRNPFVPSVNPTTGAPNLAGQNRTEPFFEFRAERLVDDDLDGIPGYLDPLGQGPAGRYFAYFSSYAGQGYDPNDIVFDPNRLNETPPVAMAFSVNFPVGAGASQTTSPLPNPYTSSPPVTPGARAATFHNPQSFQIISAGRDRLFGAGGQYTDSGTGDRLPGANRVAERDNVTNFANGTLD